MSRLTMPPRLAGAALAVLLAAAAARGQTAWYESFEGPEPSWQLDGGDAHFEVRVHDRVQGIACTGQGCERLRISGSGGTRVDFRHEIGRPRVISSLLPSVQVKSDRAGLQFSARLVLPRTTDPRTGRALRAVIHGTSYTKVGRWEQLRIEQIPDQLARRVRALRAELRTHVDPREAFIECVLLNVYGGPGVTNVWIDDLDVAGFVAAEGQWPLADAGEPADSQGPYWLPASQSSSFANAPAADRPPAPARAVLSGSILLADGRPFFPRIICHQGEPLEVLWRLGFNAVWLAEPPPAAMLSEARRLGIWLICPPPNPPEPSDSGRFALPPRPIGLEYEPVLAWDLGSGLSDWNALATRQWADQIRAADRAEGRPLVCRPECGLRTFSRYVDVLLVGRPVLGSGLELTDYGTWLRQRPRLARPGTPIWSTVQTQPPPALVAQWAALASGEPPPAAFSTEQIRLMAYTAITSGSRGLLFESESPLDAADPGTRKRAMILELLNLELLLAEPWLAAGSYVETVPGSEPEVLAAVLQTDRARLLVPVWSAANAQRVAGRAAGNRVSFIVPGVPEEYRPYLLTAGGMEPLRRNRETGGVRVTLDEFGLTAMVLLTQDPLVVNSLAQRSAQMARRAAQLRRELAAAKLESVRQVHAQLTAARSPSSQADLWLAEAQRSLQSCDRLLAVPDYSAAYLEAERVMRPLRMVERTDWQAATAGVVSPVANPSAAAFDTLPLGQNLAARFASAGGTVNALAGGDFEDLDVMLAAGWIHVERPSDQFQTAAELSPQAARSGRLGLRLALQPINAEATDTVVEMPPAWITSAPVYAEAGQWLVIRGWVQVPQPVAGSVDGLLIIDSLTGEVLAERVGQTVGWQEFLLYRAAPRSGNATVTFAMSGLGEAWIDDVTIQCLGPPAAGR